ncbi:MAG: hypothetical protein ACUVS4_17430, partial [Chloroflexaceae bacterium]
IDSGQYTRYLIGTAATSDNNPANATFKLGFVGSHSAFIPHAHGAEHFVLSMGILSIIAGARGDNPAKVW